jgi:tetratricopeptide (TPR) repeat protein
MVYVLLLPVRGNTYEKAISQPCIAVNPSNPSEIVIAALTPDPDHGSPPNLQPNAPVFVSTDGGDSWNLQNIVPNDSQPNNYGISLKYSVGSNNLYATVLIDPPHDLGILRTVNPQNGATMKALDQNFGLIPQAWVVAAYKKAVTHNEDFYAIDAAHMLGIAVKPQDQLFWNIKAMYLAEKTTDMRAGKWLGSLYNNIGWTYHNLKDYTTALTFFEKLLSWRRDQGDERGIFIAKWTIGRTYRSLQRIDEALTLQKELLDEIQRKGLDPSGYVFEELAECLLIRNRIGDAREYFRKAYDILSKDVWLKADEGARLQRLKDLSE